MSLTVPGAMLASGIIGGASSLLGNIFGWSSNNNANQTNLKIAQMNNEFNERMLQKQMDYNTEMWNKQNQYNTPAAQRARLEAAGLNPYMMMNGGSSGTAQSASGVNPPTATPVQVQPYKPDFSGINQVIASYMDYVKTRDLTAAQTANWNINNDFLPKLLWSQIFQRDADTLFKNTQTGRMQALLPYEINQAQQNIFTSQVQQAVMLGDLVNTILDANLKQKALNTYDERFRAEMSVYAADVYQKVQAGALSEKEAELAVEKKLTEVENREGIKVENQMRKDMSYWLVRGARWSAIEQSWKAQSAKNAAQKTPVYDDWFSRNYNKFINTYIAPLGSAVWGAGAGYAAGKYNAGSDDRHNKNQLKKLLKK